MQQKVCWHKQSASLSNNVLFYVVLKKTALRTYLLFISRKVHCYMVMDIQKTQHIKSCKFCTEAFNATSISANLANIDNDVCESCFSDINECMASNYPLHKHDLVLRISLRKLRTSLVHLGHQNEVIADLINTINREINSIEQVLFVSKLDNPYLRNTISEYRALTSVYM